MDITLSIDDEIAEKVRRIATEKNTTLTAMVQEYLTSLANAGPSELDAAAGEEAAEKLRSHIASVINRHAAARDAAEGKEAAEKFRETVRRLSRPMGPRNWTRDDLYDRPHAYFKRD